MLRDLDLLLVLGNFEQGREVSRVRACLADSRRCIRLNEESIGTLATNVNWLTMGPTGETVRLPNYNTWLRW